MEFSRASASFTTDSNCETAEETSATDAEKFSYRDSILHDSPAYGIND